MRAIAFGVLFTISGFLPLQLFAHTGEKPTAEAAPQEAAQELTPEMLMYSVVKINNVEAAVFSPQPQGGHGSGFFVGIDPQTKKGLIFTNRHVIQSAPGHAQQLTVEFNTDDIVAEKVRANLMYVSPLHDFAVLEFDPSKLKRAKLNLPMHLPTKDSPFLEFIANARRLRGSPVMAIGNPFNGENVFTYGEITGLQIDETGGPFIQTQTPINPGNSGGPLISRVTGEVIGINTAIIKGANSVGYATPIGPLLREFGLWRAQVAENTKNGTKSPTAADERVLTFTAGTMSADQLKVIGHYDAVTAAIPDFWRNHQTVIVVRDITTPSGLERDDILLRLDGEVIGGYPYNLFKRLQRSGETVNVEVLRNGKVVTLPVLFEGAGYDRKKMAVDYVYISGLFIHEMARTTIGRVLPGVRSRVSVKGTIESAETNFLAGSFPPPGSMIVAVNFGGEDYKVESLLDLKLAINQNRNKPWIQLRYHRANAYSMNGELHSLSSPVTGMPLLDGTVTTTVIPMREVLTPMQFSIHKFIKQFSFDPSRSETWDWRAFRHPERLPSSCPAALMAPPKAP